MLVYAAAVTFPHENVQWLMNEFALRYTHARLYQVWGWIGICLAVIFTVIVLLRLRRQTMRATLLLSWIVTLALVWSTWRSFTANNTELVHYPQYLPEGMALVALTLSPAESLAWIVIFGSLDEGYQYAVLSWWRAVPFDFNDVYMDLLGGALGVVLGMVFLQCSRRTAPQDPPLRKRPGIAAIIGILVTGTLLWASGLMLLFEDKADKRHWFALSRFRAPTFWFQVTTNGPNRYHTLSPVEGPLLILATIALYAFLDRRVRISTRPKQL